MGGTRVFLHAPRPKEPVVQAKARPPRVARRAAPAREPRLLRSLDPRFSSVLEVWRKGEGARVSSPHDPAEREADATAATIAVMPEPRHEAASMIAAASPALARKGEGQSHASRETMDEIAAASPLGRPLPTTVRRFMEPRFRADFGGVRVHTGEQAARLSSRLNAQAFTVGNQIFFGSGRFRPETPEGRELIAHELTHTIQQGAVEQAPVQRQEDATVSSNVPEHVQRLGFDDLLDWIADQANNIPGFRMFTLVLGVNPVNLRPVERSAANLLRAIVEFIPGGGLIVQALDRYGVFDRVGGWIEGQLASLGISGSSIKAALTRFIDSLGLLDLARPGAVWDRARAIFSEPIDRIIAFARGLAAQVLQFIKDAILRPLATLAAQSDGWDLLCAVLGRNPITGEPVPRNAETLIGGFMKLIGQQEIWENIKRANAIARAWAWFQGALQGLLGFVQQVPALFLDALRALTIEDIVLLPRAFARVARAFAGFLGRFFSWAGSTIWNLLEIIFSVVAPGVLVYLRRAASAFRTILRNPIGFVRNLIAAGRLGLSQFVHNFVRHLRASLIGWLTGALSGAGVYIPQAFTLLEIGKFVLSVLGITWQRIRAKIVRVIGEPAMRAIETGFEIVVALVRGGPAAAWEIIKEKLTNLKDMVIESIISFVKDRIVTAAVTRLVSMLSPVGAFIQAIIGIYNTVMFFVERMRQIAQVAAAIIDSISAIAAGAIASAANRVERTLAGLLTLAISFFARLVGLGRVSDAVVNFVRRVQAAVDRALDQAVDWIVQRARALFRSLFGRNRDDRTDAQKQADLDRGVAQAEALIGPRTTPDQIRSRLPAIKSRYRMTALELVVDAENQTSETIHIHGEINPRKDSRQRPVLVLPQELSEMRARLVLPRSREYFDEQVHTRGVAGALALFQAQDARTDTVGLRALRNSSNVGPNIERSPTVASLSANVPGLGSVAFTGVSGSFDSATPSKLRLNAVSPTHAEGRCMTRLAAAMDAVNAHGGSGTLSVDKPPCGFCVGAFTAMRSQYGVALSPHGP